MKSLAELVRVLDGAQLQGDPGLTVRDLAYDSRAVEPGDLFVCVEGFRSDGHRFAADAVRRGAVALLVEREPEGVEGVPRIVVPDCRQAMAILAAEMIGRPADRLLTVGITGTNGKTTTSYLVEAVLKARGNDPGLLGTIEARVGGSVRRLANTTPESLDLHRLFAEIERSGQDSVVMEVSSHALALDRTYGIPYDIAVFTNLTQDHLDFHGTMEEYFQAKLRLFHKLGTCHRRPCTPYAVLNLDDPYGERVRANLRVPFVTYGTRADAHVRAEDIEAGPDGLSYRLVSPLGVTRVNLQLSGLFNLHNSLAAISVGLALRMDLGRVVAAVESVWGVPGRFQLVHEGQDFTVVVDYAHTPDGLASLLRSARDITSGQLTAVFGCGGDRDRTKRPLMGEIGATLADRVILTTDNPRTEDPQDILAQILEGTRRGKAQVEVLGDRAEAIRQAIHAARPGDTVVVAGKGHETAQIFRDRTIRFDDVECAVEAIRSRPFRRTDRPPGMRPVVRWDLHRVRSETEMAVGLPG
jgi:UDP-N-acetylmuramoyl-L-alanyl-D-glutamate--2,6-diaminopimelate ligase